MNKTYYRLVMNSKSPLRISKGDHENSDSDVMLDGRGFPFIPGTGLAGILRALIPDDRKKEELFGEALGSGDPGRDIKSSLILVSDAVLDTENPMDFTISSRDGIGLDEWGMVKKGAKYDFEMVETGKPFVAVLECNFESADQEKYFDGIMETVTARGLKAGARTTRGFGLMEAVIYKRSFSFPRDIDEWLDHSPFEPGYFDTGTKMGARDVLNDETCIRIEFVLEGNILIRLNQVNTAALDDGSNPDCITLMNYRNKPVIPGTAWAGVFRHHMIRLMHESGTELTDEAAVNRLFGMTEDDKARSGITFSESEIDGGAPYAVMRTAVDRFTAAAINSGLFTTQACSGGEGTLVITYRNDRIGRAERMLLAAALFDMDAGLLSVGGEASVGRGTVKIKSFTVNGRDAAKELAEHSLDVLEV